MMDAGLVYLNEECKYDRLGSRNDTPGAGCYFSNMAQPRNDWYFNEWLAYFDKSQADVSGDLEWNKSKVSLFASGKQRFHRDDINDLAAYLHLEPFELLLPPDRAMAFRAFRASAEQVIKEAPEPANFWTEKLARGQHRKPAKKGTGTHG